MTMYVFKKINHEQTKALQFDGKITDVYKYCIEPNFYE